MAWTGNNDHIEMITRDRKKLNRGDKGVVEAVAGVPQQARTKTLACRVQGAAWDAKEVDDNVAPPASLSSYVFK